MTGTEDFHRCALLVEYDGTAFRGWSRQPDTPGVEGTLLAALHTLESDDITMRCAGRTDAGVHATGQVVSLHYRGAVPVERIRPALNGVLPGEVAIVDAVPCGEDFDARACARSRAYEYRVLTRRVHSPVRADRVLHHPRPLDEEVLEAAAEALRGTHDFTAFTPTKTLHRHFHRTIIESRWERQGDELVYTIRGNTFLRHMVRVLVGSMLMVGRGEAQLEWFTGLLDGLPRELGGNTAPPHGLYLVDVEYGDEWNLPATWRVR